MARIVVLGAGGFIGQALCARLGASATAVTRGMGTLYASTDWAKLIDGAGAVVHLANRAHAPAGDGAWIDAEVALSAAIGRAARATDAHLLYLSSIKVHGEASRSPFRADDPPHPADAYGRAKLQSEAAMAAAGVTLTILRPPLIYGPGVKANFRALIRLVDRGLPLPFASIENRRSFLFIDNLVDLIEAALAQRRPGIFLARDDDEPSTPALIKLIAEKLARPARLFACPPALLSGVANLLGQGGAAERLLGTLRLDDGATRQALGWRPKISLADGIALTCQWYRAANSPIRSA
jgi:nucleoside-diphosphate-sugar epimerase